MTTRNIIPRLFVKSKGEQTTKLSLMLTNARRKALIRLTGGCGGMSADDAEGMYDLFRTALVGFDGAMVFGGTRMIYRDDPERIWDGITEIPEQIRSTCPDMTVLGIIPRTEHINLTENGMVVANDPNDPYVTIVHPSQDIVLVVQVSADDPEIWDAEYHESLRISGDLRSFCSFAHVTIAWNGGSVTRREIELTARDSLPTIIIRGSGRTCDALAEDREFLALHRTVRAVDKDAGAIRSALDELGITPKRGIRLVSASRSA